MHGGLKKKHYFMKTGTNSMWYPKKVDLGKYTQLAEKANLLMRDCHISPFLLFSMLFMLYVQQSVSPEFSNIERFFTIHLISNLYLKVFLFHIGALMTLNYH